MDGEEVPSEINGGSRVSLDLPAGFAGQVLVLVRAERRRRRTRRRSVLIACCVLLAAAIPASTLLQPHGSNRAGTVAAFQERSWHGESLDEAVAYKIAQSSLTESAGDFLLPDTRALTEFSSTYIDASWHYDPYWTDSR
jgi:hypothetical protein